MLPMKRGYVDECGGFNGLFSWWRTTTGPWLYWYVCGHGQFCTDGRAIVDDFGNLVKVPYVL